MRTHGLSGYQNYGCRCGICREAKRVSMQKYRQELRARFALADQFGLVPHGTSNGYQNYGCRCTDCRSAEWEVQRDCWKNRKMRADG